MSNRMRGQPPHRHSGEFLQEVVAEVVPEEECERYLVFAQELYVSLRCGPKMGDSPTEQRVGLAAVQSPFSARTKRVVMKYFRRGLHGNLMWRIGERLMGRHYPSSDGAMRTR